jgi:hypothetical protein
MFAFLLTEKNLVYTVSTSATPHARGYQRNLRMCTQKSSGRDRFLHATVFGLRNSTKLGRMYHNYRTINQAATIY